MKMIMQRIAVIETEAHLELADRQYTESLNTKNRGARMSHFKEMMIHLNAAISLFELITDKKDATRKMSHIFWSICETSAMEFWSACYKPAEKHLPAARDIGLISVLYGLMERGKDLETMNSMLISTFEKALSAGFGNGNGHYIYGKNCLGTYGKTDIAVFRSLKNRIARWVKRTESALRQKVESLHINPDGTDTKTAYLRIIEKRVRACQKDAHNISNIKVNIDWEEDAYDYMVYRGDHGCGGSGEISQYWKKFLDGEKVGRVLSLSGGEVSDEFAILTGQNDIMDSLKA